MPKALLTRVALVSLLALSVGSAHAQSARTDKADDFLRPLLSSMSTDPGTTAVLVRLKAKLTPLQRARLSTLGGDIYRHLPLIQSVALRIPTRHLFRLAALPFIEHLSADLTVRKNDVFTTERSGATTAWSSYGLSGAGVGIAVVDSGIDDSRADITSNVSTKISFVAGQTADPLDRTGHGTHVAGIIAGTGSASSSNSYQRFYGIAPQAKLISVRVLSRDGSGTTSDTIAGLQWIKNNKTTHNIRVVNLSLGHAVGESYTTDPLCQAVEALWKSGIVVVCAAGNSGRITDTSLSGISNEGYGTAYGSIQSPGNDPYIITVGAMKAGTSGRSSDRLATYSSRGPSRLDFVMKPDLVAPGNRVISVMGSDGSLIRTSSNTVYRSEYIIGANAKDISTDYLRLSGTSMAAPVVSGAVALLLQRSPSLSPDTIKARLMLSATKWTEPTTGLQDPCSYGAGYLNIPGALQNTAVATLPATSPSLYQDSAGNVYVDMSKVLWGSKVIWGVNTLTDLKVIWGSKVIWGNSNNILDASRVIWGNTIWMDKVIWGVTTTTVDLTARTLNGE